VLHNFKEYEDIDTVQKHINEDITYGFNAYYDNMTKCWNHVYKEMTIRHLVIAKEGTPAGSFYNDETFKILKQWIFAQTNPPNNKPFLEKFEIATELTLPNYFYPDKVDPCPTIPPSWGTIIVAKTIIQSFWNFFTGLLNEQDRPFKLKVENDLIKLERTRPLFYLPFDVSYNPIGYYDPKYRMGIVRQEDKPIYVIEIELPGFKIADIEVKGAAGKVTILGKRCPNIQVEGESSTIPFGSVKRIIFLPEKIDGKTCKMSTFVDGYLTIFCHVDD